jgi:hypothetical protein
MGVVVVLVMVLMAVVVIDGVDSGDGADGDGDDSTGIFCFFNHSFCFQPYSPPHLVGMGWVPGAFNF